MRTLLLPPLLLTIAFGVTASAQQIGAIANPRAALASELESTQAGTAADAQRIIAEKFPEIAKAGTPEHLVFLALFNFDRGFLPEAGRFAKPDWPLKLAAKVAAIGGNIPQTLKSGSIPHNQLLNYIYSRSRDEVKTLLGPPSSTMELSRGVVSWRYDGMARNPDTEKMGVLKVEFHPRSAVWTEREDMPRAYSTEVDDTKKTLNPGDAMAEASSQSASDFLPGQYDKEAERLLRTMSRVLPLRTTALQEIAPEFSVEMRAGLSWAEAVAEADSQFGRRQPQRAAFLRKYLGDKFPESALRELQLEISGNSTRTGGGESIELIFGDVQKPVAAITVWIATNQLVGKPTLCVFSALVKGMVYSGLAFDVDDRLISASHRTQPDRNGVTITVGENTSGTGGVNFYYAIISGPDGVIEDITFTPELVIKERRSLDFEGIRQMQMRK